MKAREPLALLKGSSKLRRLYRTLAFRRDWAACQLDQLTEAIVGGWESRVVHSIAAELVRANLDLPKAQRLQIPRRPETE